jgi:hypothetical protein
MGIIKSKLVHINDVGENIRLIDGSDNYYISEYGNVYHRFDEYLYKKMIQINPKNGYVYCAIYYNGNSITKRVHKLVASAFIPNPNNYPAVDHKDDIKTHNWVDNLVWCTVSHNTQKAYDKGLARNAISYQDSQAMPVTMYEAGTNREVFNFGSIREAARCTDMEKSTIARQCKYERPARLPFYFRYNKNVSATTIENYNRNIVSRVVVNRAQLPTRSTRPLIDTFY